ncbi:MAG: oligosaccharide flippase family protein, partial [Candidatus Erginobacter occultus]|nr:oligosaccharide flippase family protein [Candidatus Erginobacter occultus]
PELDRSIRGGALQLQLALGLGLGLAIWLAAPGLSRIWGDPAFTGYIRLTAFFLPAFGLYSVYRGVLNGHTRFGAEARVSMIYSALKVIFLFLLIALFIALDGDPLYGAVGGYLAAIIGAVFLARAFCPPAAGDPGRSYPLGKIVSFAFPVVLFSFILSLVQHLDLYFVRALVPGEAKVAAGLYTCAQQFARIPYMLLYALSLTVFPVVAARTALPGGREAAAGVIRRALRGGMLVVFPLAALIGGTAGPLLGWVYGPDSAAGGPALEMLIFGQILLALLLVLATIITARGRPWTSFALVAATLALSALFNRIWVPAEGIRGAAIATTLAAGLGTAAAGVIVFQDFGALLAPAAALRIIPASLLLFVLARRWSPAGWMLPPALAALAVLYLVLLFLLREIKTGDGKMLLALFRKPRPTPDPL